jgi:hypothetical protein
MFSTSHNVPQWASDAKTTLILGANEAALKLWRYPRDKFIGLPATNLLCAEEVPRAEKLKHINLWGETGPWKCTRGDGSVFFMRVRWQQIIYSGQLCDYVFCTEMGDSLETMQPLPELIPAKSPNTAKP